MLSTLMGVHEFRKGSLSSLRESVLHELYEMDRWLEMYVKKEKSKQVKNQ
jgi:hypothetical protein